jgi:hypothetical protein
LKVDAVQVAALRRKYAKPGCVIVGLCWASKGSGQSGSKTLALADFAPLLKVPNVVFVDLQYAADADERAAVQAQLGIQIITDSEVDLGGDMDVVAAQVAAMDLVVSVSNTTVHLAGALNVPVWNIVPGHNATGLWHWFADGETSPWYPSMRIYRRRSRTSGALMQQIAGDLKQWVAAPEPS